MGSRVENRCQTSGRRLERLEGTNCVVENSASAALMSQQKTGSSHVQCRVTGGLVVVCVLVCAGSAVGPCSTWPLLVAGDSRVVCGGLAGGEGEAAGWEPGEVRPTVEST